MTAFLIYVLKSALVLALLVSLFMIFMSRETFHRVNRYIMLSIVSIALLLPAVNLGIESPFNGLGDAIKEYLAAEEPLLAADTCSMPVHMAAFDELPVLPEAPLGVPSVIMPVEEEPFNWLLLAAVVYFAGVALLVVRQVVMYVQVARMIARGRVVDASMYGCKGISLRVHRGKEKPFSWFRWVVVSENDLAEGAREILIHETAHAHAGHSWDIVLADAVIIMQWFNPLAWIMKNSLKDIHEFEADEAVINSGVNAKQYQLLIIKKAVGARLYSIANSFNHSLTKKRITMMCKEKSKKWRCAKALYIVPVAAIAALAFTTVEPVNAAESETLPKGSEIIANNEKETAENYVQQLPDGDDKVYQVCENAPAFPGGTYAMYKYLADNIKYPADAKAAGKEGRVIVQFVVRKDGSVSDVSVVRSVGNVSLDNEAVRVVSSMPKWSPGTQGGKPVNVQYTLPVQFKLSDGKINNEKRENEKKDYGTVTGDGIVGNPSLIVNGQKVDAPFTQIADNYVVFEGSANVSVILDGEPYEGNPKDLDPKTIESITAIGADKLSADDIKKYNAKDKDGIIFITTSSGSHAGIVGNPTPVVNGKKEDPPFTVDFNVEERTADGEKIYQICEKAPEFPGGMAELMKWLRMNVRYPKAARDINGQGRVLVRFVVRADGSISNAEVVKSDFSSDYSEVSHAEQTAKEIERYKTGIERIENDCKELEQHIEEWKNKLAVLEKDGTSENILNRRREELEEVQKLLEDERAKIVIMKRTLAQKEEMLANSKNELDKIMVTTFKNEKGEVMSTDEVVALRAAAENALKDEAVRVIMAMPKWNPGTQGGEAVNVSYTLPVMFRLR
ncbi:MAG: TonB family protein [Bacteroidales bacterium]|nr:TonB family protein [Bacteroidales bacterium]